MLITQLCAGHAFYFYFNVELPAMFDSKNNTSKGQPCRMIVSLL